MELRCTCGALLPDEARFCHKCGKPQYEEDIARLSAPEPSAVPVQGPFDVPAENKSAPIGFGNLRAVTVTIAVAAITLLPLAIAMIAPPLSLLVLCAAGYFAAHFYRKQSRQPLSPGAGAYLGAMTGVWLSLVFAVCGALISIQVSSPDNLNLMRAYLARMPEAAKMLENPHQFVVGMGQALLFLFFLATITAAFGGMLAGRKSARRSQS